MSLRAKKTTFSITSPLLDQVDGEALLKVIDVLVIDNPNLLISINDIVRSFMTPMTMLGLVVYDIINWANDLFAVQSVDQSGSSMSTNAFNINQQLGIPDVQTSNSLDGSADLANALSIMHWIMKGAFYGLDFAIELLVGEDRLDDGQLQQQTLTTKYVARSMM